MMRSRATARLFFALALVFALAPFFPTPKAQAVEAVCADGDRQLCKEVTVRGAVSYYYWV